jgi:hypothetical protein
MLFANSTAIIVFYVIALVIDVLLAVNWLSRALRYSKRASRGETFSVRSVRARPQTRGIPAKD